MAEGREYKHLPSVAIGSKHRCMRRDGRGRLVGKKLNRWLIFSPLCVQHVFAQHPVVAFQAGTVCIPAGPCRYAPPKLRLP